MMLKDDVPSGLVILVPFCQVSASSAWYWTRYPVGSWVTPSSLNITVSDVAVVPTAVGGIALPRLGISVNAAVVFQQVLIAKYTLRNILVTGGHL